MIAHAALCRLFENSDNRAAGSSFSAKGIVRTTDSGAE
jgi:hypothetical protein